MKKMLHAAIKAAVDAVSTKDESVKEDVVHHLATAILTGGDVDTVANQIKKMIEDLSEQFSRMSLKKSQVIGYLLEHLDIPRNKDGVELGQNLIALSKAAEASDSIAVVPTTFDFSTAAPNGVIALREDNNDAESKIVDTVIYIKLNKAKAVLFVLSESLHISTVVTADGNYLVEKQPDYEFADIGKALEELTDSLYMPNLMGDRETIDVEGLDVAWMDNYVEQNPDVFNVDYLSNGHGVVDIVVNAYVKENEIDAKDKRLVLTHLDELMKRGATIAGIIGEQQNADVPSVEVDVADEDASLFSQGVVEQSIETTAPVVSDTLPVLENTSVDLFDTGIEDANIVEEGYTSTVSKAIELLKALGEDPERGSRIISNSSLPIKDSLYNDVMNSLPTIEKRPSDDYNENERKYITETLAEYVRPVLDKINAYRAKIEKEMEEALPFKPKMVEDVIVASPVHSHFLTNVEKRAQVIKSVTEYLNNHQDDVIGDHTNHINHVLSNIALYDYESEALINSTYRSTNVPTSDRLIRNTGVISTAVRKLFTPAKGWTASEEAELTGVLNGVFNNGGSALDLSKESVELFTARQLEPKQFTKAGTYVVVMPPVLDNEHVACVIVMSASTARILNIDRANSKVVGVSVIDKPEQRSDVLNLLMNA